MTDYRPDSQFEGDLRQAFGVPEATPEFSQALYLELQKQAAQRARRPSRYPSETHRPRVRWAWLAAILVAVSLLIVFRQPVIASIGQVFGFTYVPGMGFVAMDQVQVLGNAVQQEHEGRTLTVTQGLATTYLTQLWLTYSDEARPVDGAWLETAAGERLELQSWDYSPDEVGTSGVVAYFPPLPAAVHAITLVLPEGWHLPLAWVPGVESDLVPANVIQLTPAVTEGQPLPDDAGSPCAETHGITFCVQAAAREWEDLHVLVETSASGDYRPDTSMSSMFHVFTEADSHVLSDAAGQEFLVSPGSIHSQEEPERTVTTLTFPGAAGVTGPLQLTIPAVLVSLPLDDMTLVVDLGDDPQPGQVIPLDQTIEVAGQTVHFSQAELVGEGTTLTLYVDSDPIDNSAALRLYLLEPGRPEGVEDRYGYGTSRDHFSLTVQLYQRSEIMTGVLRIPLISATFKVRGPFVLNFEAPPATAGSAATPEVVSGVPYEPVPTGEPLPIDAYQYSGEALLPGDLLSVEVQEDYSRVYAASPDAGFAQRWVADLPGEVMAVQAHADWQGLDYLTGVREENGNQRYEQLYSLRFVDGSPRMLIGQFRRETWGFDWSYDNRFFVYRETLPVPGEESRMVLQIVDLATCWEIGACEPITAYEEGAVGWPVWSPTAYQIAMAATPSRQMWASEVYVLTFDPDTRTVSEVRQLTEAPEINFGELVWANNGERIYGPCMTPEIEVNEYALCQADLTMPVDVIAAPLLPWNMQNVNLAGGRWIVDYTPVMQEGFYRLRAYDLQTGESFVYLEWPAEGKFSIEATAAPESAWVAVAQDGRPELRLVNVETQVQVPVQPVLSAQLYFGGWVP